MKKACFVFILLMMVLLCGCDGDTGSTSAVNDSSQNEDGSVAYSIADGEDFELRTYSPDGVNYIREEYDDYAPGEERDDYGRVNLYLNDETQRIKQVLIENLDKYIKQPRSVWMDDDNVILRGRYTLNIKNMVIENIDFDKLGIYVKPAAEDYATVADESDAQVHFYSILNYDVNNGGNKISYLLSEYPGANLCVYIYDLQKQTWEKVYYRPETVYDTSGGYCIGWDNYNNLYFADWKNVYKYDGQTVEVFYAKDTIIFYMAVSPQGKYMVVCNAGGKSDQDNFRKGQFSYIDLADGEVKFTFASLGNNAFCPPFTWSSDDKAFVYVDTDGVIKVISLPDMKELISQEVENPKEIDMIDYWDGTFVCY